LLASNPGTGESTLVQSQNYDLFRKQNGLVDRLRHLTAQTFAHDVVGAEMGDRRRLKRNVNSSEQRNWNTTMKEKNSPSAAVSETNSPDTVLASTEEEVQRHWQGLVKRRSFLKGPGIAGAALSAGTLLATEGTAQTSSSTAFVLPFDEAEPRGPRIVNTFIEVL
jgi:hypothetical protein